MTPPYGRDRRYTAVVTAVAVVPVLLCKLSDIVLLRCEGNGQGHCHDKIDVT